ncbi:hypothetical protein HYU14_03725 [Candidatus Woesearchaeota archaeon]|nr:hypothetical protein [Candidatus Woesearchaeota archaeon]
MARDRKTHIIWALSLLVFLLLGFIGVQSFLRRVEQQRQQSYLDGVRYGQLLEQRAIVSSLFAAGYYLIPVVDENNQSQNIAVGLIQGQQAQALQAGLQPKKSEVQKK